MSEGEKVVVYKDKAGEYRWKKLAANNRIVANSGEGYTERNDATEAAKREFPFNTVVQEDG